MCKDLRDIPELHKVEAIFDLGNIHYCDVKLPHDLNIPIVQSDVPSRVRSVIANLDAAVCSRYPWIKGADLLVLCSDFEGLANVLIESLIVGTRVVSTNCPSGPEEVIGSLASHCLVPAGDVPALREAIYRSVSRDF